MISEERVKELYHLAAFDEYENKKYHQAGEYTMWDYVGKEIVKSFFSGTIAFILRYAKGYRKMKAYGNHLKRARRLLREEK